jgi:hypothetical protein
MSEPKDEHYNMSESRLAHKSPAMFQMLQRTYERLTEGREMDEKFRKEIRDLLQSIDHIDRA